MLVNITIKLFENQGAKRWHCGEFRVYAENENGEDVASILVTVTCMFLNLKQTKYHPPVFNLIFSINLPKYIIILIQLHR